MRFYKVVLTSLTLLYFVQNSFFVKIHGRIFNNYRKLNKVDSQEEIHDNVYEELENAYSEVDDMKLTNEYVNYNETDIRTKVSFSSLNTELFKAATDFEARHIIQFYKELSKYIQNFDSKVNVTKIINGTQIVKFKINAYKLCRQRTKRLRRFTKFIINLFSRVKIPKLKRYNLYINIINILDRTAKYNSNDKINWEKKKREIISWSVDDKRPEKGTLKTIMAPLLDILVKKSIALNHLWPESVVIGFKRNLAGIMRN